MARIKIISNPYKKETRFQKWNINESNWVDIDYESNKNSKLLSEELTSGFFPFKVKKIVELLVQEYENGDELLEIFFDGSADEYQELASVCDTDVYAGKVSTAQTENYLENARDILPEVINLFQKMSPLIVQSVSQDKIQRDLNRFTDASSDVVPICVLGNYSAGKSTFINALIGSEILPSGTEPVTARIYKISRSKYQDRAYIRCQYLGFDVTIQFTDKNTKFGDGTIDNDLTILIRSSLQDSESESIVMRVNKVLSVINGFESNTDSPEISDLIEVDIPFVNGVLAETQHPFIIFDTPGSNSASNARHLQVLKEAMANMTNGLPIFLSTPDSLDSTDNENLYHIIRDMDELDNRFTMIVVNKADSAGIQRRGNSEVEKNRIMNQAVPKNLYSSGIFYVSSILGLGAKTDGRFFDYDYEDVYDAQVNRYKDPNNKHYRTLYLFNIMPEQLKARSDNQASKQANLVYANSGMFTVESEIETFAGKYSAYNKCFQSQMFLTRVIQITGEEIEDNKFECEGIRQSIKDKLEADKKALVEKIDHTSSTRREEYEEHYSEYMSEYLNGTDEIFSAQALKKQETEFTKQLEEDMDFESHAQDASNARTALGSNFVSNFGNALKERKSASFRKVVDNFQSDLAVTKEMYHTRHEVRQQVDKKTADNMIGYVSGIYDAKLKEKYQLLDTASQNYWTSRTEQLRRELATIVSGSDVLTETRRQELEHIIITYRPISFSENSSAEIFTKENFERKLRVGKWTFWESDHLNIDKLARTFNEHIDDGIKNGYLAIEESHKESALQWIQSLLDEIYENIVEYSPELSKQAKQIRIMTDHIVELEQRRLQLEHYTEELEGMMDWKISG